MHIPISGNCTRILLIADPQLLGLTYSKTLYSGLARFDADRFAHNLVKVIFCFLSGPFRYLRQTFKQALAFTKPHIICFLGDLMDEGNVASPEEFKSYVKRFQQIYRTDDDPRVSHDVQLSL